MWFLFTILCLLSSPSFIKNVDAARNTTCLHKADYRFHQNPPIDTKALRESLARYNKIHGEAEQRQSIKEAFEAEHKDDVKNKYVYVEMSTSGLGNRLMATISSFLLALLTDRVLVIRSTSFDAREVFCDPFNASTWFVPEDVDMTKLDRGGKVKKIDGSHAGEITQMSRDDFATLHQEPIWYIREMEQYFLPVFFANPHYVPKLSVWFPARNVATILTRELIHPSDNVWKNILDTWSQRNAMDYTVGMQVRWPTIGIGNALDCFKHGLNEDRTHFFVASLRNVKEFLVHQNPNWIVTQKYMEGAEQHHLQQTQHALHDMWIMSLTDETVVSAHSTFGYIIMAVKGETCLMAKENLDDGDCFYPDSHEPCFHLASHAFDYKQSDYVSSFVDCEDFKGGVKLRV